jgi:hypothetical protein
MTPTASIIVHSASVMANPQLMQQAVVGSAPPSDHVVASSLAHSAAPVSGRVVVSATVQKSSTVASVNPAILHLQHPEFRPVFIPQAQPRSSFSLPTLISPDVQPTDHSLFEEPQDCGGSGFLDSAIS